MKAKRKFASGGSVAGQRPTEDRARMAAEAAAGFDAEEAALAARVERRSRANPWTRGESIITNRPVGQALRRFAGRSSGPRMSDAGEQPAIDLIMPPPEPPRAPRRAVATRTRRTDSATEDLNARSLAAAREGRNMYKKGGKVTAKPKAKPKAKKGK